MKRSPALVLMLAAGAAATPNRTAELRKTAAPVWTAYTRDHVTELMKTRQWVHMVFRHDSKAVSYTVHGDQGTVSARGTLMATKPFPTRAAAAAAPWKVKQPVTLVLSFTWRDGSWRPGSVAWKP